jgi:GNAT superfamily N-acetyltransferase
MSTTTATDIRVIDIDQVREATALVERNHREIDFDKDLQELDPNWPHYYALSEAGLLIVLGAYADRELVGYSIDALVESHPHYRGICVGQGDVIYVAPEHREGGVGVRMIQMADQMISEWARSIGKRCMRMLHSKSTEAGLALAGLLPKLGYVSLETVYSKEL